METTSALSGKGFVQSLYDFRFASLIGPRFIKFLYAVGVGLDTLVFGLIILRLVSAGGAGPVLALFMIAVYAFVVIALRVAMEILIVVFYIGEDVRSIRVRGGAALGRPAGSAGRPAGWYDSPNDVTRLRYWDGTAWTDHDALKPTAAS